MAVAALDFGTRRIGVAVADATGLIASPLCTLKRRSIRTDLEALDRLLKARQIDRIIVGLPLNMDGSEGPMARAARAFAGRLGLATGLAVELLDERLSSFEARDRLAAFAPRARRKASIDAVAAAVILESWLKRNRR